MVGSVVTVSAPRLGLPAGPAIRQQDIQLGQVLFFSSVASRDGQVSCASCHDPARAFSDGKPTSTGVEGLLGTRNAPSLRSAAFSTSLMWDGRRATLEEQVLHPLTTRVEHGLTSNEQALSLWSRDTNVAKILGGKTLTAELARAALAAYVRSLATGNSDFDRFAFGAQTWVLTSQQKQGLKLFQQVGCAACHTTGQSAATFTDNLFHISSQIASLTETERLALVSEAKTLRPDQLDDVITTNSELAKLGRYLVSYDAKDFGAFKTPSLRDASRTAPYFHDGSVETLDAAVRHELSYRSQQVGQPIVLDDQEIQAIVSFIESLDSR